VNDELTAAAAALPPPSDGDDESNAAPGLPDSLRPYKESEAVLAAWGALFKPTEPLAHAIVSLQNHVLPVPTVVNQLLLAVCAISGVSLEAVLDPHSHEPSWPIIRKVCLNA
jgi:hypothetical protein